MRGYLRVMVVVIAVLAWWAVLPAQADENVEHAVAPGETLRRIAERYGVTIEALATANRIVNPNLIFAGQVLLIPDGPGMDETPVEEQAGEQAGEEDGEKPVAVVHVVQAGETLTRIAAQYGITAAELVRDNGLGNANLIFAGQRLVVHGEPDEGAVVEEQTGGGKRIVVDKSEQRAYVYEGETLRWTFVVSTGMPGSDTWEGTFAVRSKITNAYAQLWGLQMPYWLGFYHTGYLENGFHALPIMPSGAVLWDGYLGTPVSYGCVILSYEDAATLFNWAEIGTTVIVQP